MGVIARLIKMIHKSEPDIECYQDTIVRKRNGKYAWTMESNIGLLHSIWTVTDLVVWNIDGVGVDRDTGSVYLLFEANPFGFTYNWKKDIFDVLGKICELDKGGNLIEKHDDITDAALNSFQKRGTVFSFETLFNDGRIISRSGVSFLGCKHILQCFDQSSLKFLSIRWLNDSIKNEKQMIRYLGGIEKYKEIRKYNKDFFEWSYCLEAYNVTQRFSWFLKRRKNFSHDEYNENLKNLLQLYTVQNKCLFQKVDDLTEYNGPGIYIITIDEIGGIYIGLTDRSLKERILQHFKKPSRSGVMDTMVGIADISSVYVLPLRWEHIHMAERIEADCICAVDSKYSLNSQMPTSGGCFISNMIDEGDGGIASMTVNRSKKYKLKPKARKALYDSLL